MTDNPKGASPHPLRGQAPFSIIRSRRKTIGLQINSKAELIIRAPFGVPQIWIDRMVREKHSWIEKTRERIMKQMASRKVRTFAEGETLEYLGQSYFIAYREGMKKRVELEDQFWIASEFRAHAPDLLMRWFKKKAMEYLPPIVKQYCDQLALKMPSIKINTAKGRWGSCSTQGGINFSYRLMMAPAEVVSYVAAHEAAHLKEQNHGKHFWKLVEFLCPDYRAHERWLKQKGNELVLSE